MQNDRDLFEEILSPREVRNSLSLSSTDYQRLIRKGILRKGSVTSQELNNVKKIIDRCIDRNILIDDVVKYLNKSKVTISKWIKIGMLHKADDYRKGIYLDFEEVLRLKNRMLHESINGSRLNRLHRSCRECGREGKKLYSGICRSCFRNSRETNFLNAYQEGKTLQEIASKEGLTRERVRQIISRAVKIENEIIEDSNVSINWDNVKKINKSNKVENKNNNSEWYQYVLKHRGALVKKATLHHSLAEYLESLPVKGVPAKEFKQLFPEIISEIKPRWARDHDRCEHCKTVAVRHKMYGYCIQCYHLSPQYKDIQQKSREKNLHRWKPRMKEYEKKYLDHKYFSGNRESAMLRDGYLCQLCGITRADSFSKYHLDLFVSRKNGNNDDSDLENLITLCKGCYKNNMAELLPLLELPLRDRVHLLIENRKRIAIADILKLSSECDGKPPLYVDYLDAYHRGIVSISASQIRHLFGGYQLLLKASGFDITLRKTKQELTENDQ